MSRYPKKYDGELGRVYGVLRAACIELEQLIGQAALDDKQAKRLDKAVVAMKIGFKIMKKSMRKAQAVKLKVVA